MDERTKTLFSLSLSAVALVVAGCGYTQPSRFQTSFLPPPPKQPARTVEIAEPPVLPPNVFLQDVPFLTSNPLPRRSRADAIGQRAEQAFQRGRSYYQSNDISNARREFDAAVDLMLEASEQNPVERQDYEKRLDEM